MGKLTSKAGIAFLAFFLATTLFAIEVPLKYEKYPDEPRSFLPSGFAQLNIRPRDAPLPGEPWTLPHLNTENPVYAFAKIGDKERLFILDIQNANDPFYNRLYFDANGNHNLRDDPVIDAISTSSADGRSSNVRFPAVDTAVEVDGKSLPYSFRPVIWGFSSQISRLKIDSQNLSRLLSFRLQSNCSYSAEFQVDGRKYRLILGDKNCNGRFAEPLTFDERYKFLRLDKIIGPVRINIFARGDSIYITSDEKNLMMSKYTETGCWSMTSFLKSASTLPKAF